jgi:hypothetical protein
MIDERHRRVVRFLLVAQFVAGGLMIGLGLFIVPLLPHVMMDVVLTPDELRDEAKFNTTLALLQHSVPFYMTTWIIAGLFVITTSAVCYRFSDRYDGA